MRRWDLKDFSDDHNPLFADIPEVNSHSRAKSVMRRAIKEALTDKQRACISLYYGRNMNLAEVGQELSINKSTVCRHLKAGKAKIREIMEISGAADDMRFFN